MSTVSHVFIIKPRPGHLEGFLKGLGKVNAAVKRAGGKMRAWNENSGPNPGAIAVVVENADWKAYAAYRSKLDSDPEMLSLRAEIEARKEPFADTISTGINEEVPS
jgi:hypothetical protein